MKSGRVAIFREKVAGNGSPGIQHQAVAIIRTGRDRPPVRLTHLFGRQNFVGHSGSGPIDMIEKEFLRSK